MSIDEILDALKECDFYHLTEDNFEDKIISNIPMDVDYNCGVSKVAIFFPDTNFVVKIPFGGFEDPDEEYDEDNNEYYETGDYHYSSFQFADDGETGDDYCKVEVIRYGHALDLDDGEGEIAQLFARTTFIGYVNDYPIYTQPICDVFCCVKKSSDYDRDTCSSTKEQCAKKGYNCFNVEWLSDVIAMYGQAVFDKFCQFLKDENITDLHTSNIGYLGGRPVLFDYSSYND